MGSNRYGNINELIEEVNALGNWKDPAQKDNYFRILAKINVLYQGYNIGNEEKKSYYPSEVFKAICIACREKFPKDHEVFNRFNKYRFGVPQYARYFTLVQEPKLISLMGERISIDKIAESDFGIDVYNEPATREDVEGLIESSKEYYANYVKEQKEKAVEKRFFGKDLEQCVAALEKMDKLGKSVYVVINGHKLYSADVTLESAYELMNGAVSINVTESRTAAEKSLKAVSDKKGSLEVEFEEIEDEIEDLKSLESGENSRKQADEEEIK